MPKESPIRRDASRQVNRGGEIKRGVTTRLSRIEGQVRGIQRMVDEDRYCIDILVQISAIHESLRRVGEVLLRAHLSHCVTSAVTSSDARKAEQIYDELAELFRKYAR
ncbi:MAG: metal-sensitive transcriptional regulator [Thermoanaerobaculia bacterium]